MSDVTTEEHREYAGEIKRLMAIYKEAEDLINIGAYVKGSSDEIDLAIEKMKLINKFLAQKVSENVSAEETFWIWLSVLLSVTPSRPLLPPW